jgi:hypothetical protein
MIERAESPRVGGSSPPEEPPHARGKMTCAPPQDIAALGADQGGGHSAESAQRRRTPRIGTVTAYTVVRGRHRSYHPATGPRWGREGAAPTGAPVSNGSIGSSFSSGSLPHRYSPPDPVKGPAKGKASRPGAGRTWIERRREHERRARGRCSRPLGPTFARSPKTSSQSPARGTRRRTTRAHRHRASFR